MPCFREGKIKMRGERQVNRQCEGGKDLHLEPGAWLKLQALGWECGTGQEQAGQSGN